MAGFFCGWLFSWPAFWGAGFFGGCLAAHVYNRWKNCWAEMSLCGVVRPKVGQRCDCVVWFAQRLGEGRGKSEGSPKGWARVEERAKIRPKVGRRERIIYRPNAA